MALRRRAPSRNRDHPRSLSIRLITWNVARRTTQLPGQARVLAAREPDVVALQEITRRSNPLWRRAFELIGLGHVRSSLDEADPARTPAGPRATGVMLAAREELGEAVTVLPVPWAETVIGARTAGIEVFSVHVPNAANGWIKPQTLEAVRSGLAEADPQTPRVLCGDLNTPRRELPSGEVVSFACDSRGKLRPERGEPWDSAELGVVPGLRDLGYADAFRTLHGYEAKEPSWTWRQIAGHGGGWRLDHIFASHLTPEACHYHHDWRDQGLSDHSALEADLEPDAG